MGSRRLVNGSVFAASEAHVWPTLREASMIDPFSLLPLLFRRESHGSRQPITTGVGFGRASPRFQVRLHIDFDEA
jgi:hypothetical protein